MYQSREDALSDTYRIRHSGDIGDIIYACMSFKELAKPVDLILTVRTDGAVREPMTAEKAESIKSLLILQPYIHSIEFSPEQNPDPETLRLNADMDDFRSLLPYTDPHLSLALTMRMKFEYNPDRPCNPNDPWLVSDGKSDGPIVVFARSHRYHNLHFPWSRVAARYPAWSSGFIGTSREYEDFLRAANFRKGDEPRRLHTPNLMEVARYIASSKLFIGNQSAPYAIAEGLKVRTLQEVCLAHPNCIFARPGATYGWDERVVLPEIK